MPDNNENRNNSAQANPHGDRHDDDHGESPARRARPMTAHGPRRKPAEGSSQGQGSNQKYVEPRKRPDPNGRQFGNHDADETATDSTPAPMRNYDYNRPGSSANLFTERDIRSYNSCDNDSGHEFGGITYEERGYKPSWGRGDQNNRFGPSSESPSTSCRDNYEERRSHVSQLSREEAMVNNDTRYLLNLFIQQRAEEDRFPNEPVIRGVCRADKSQTSFTDENLHDIALTLRRIGDEISSDMEFNRFIDQVPVESTQEVFWKVCERLFQDGNMNWGRIVMVFYFAYRLITRAVTKSLEELPWVKQLLSWVVEFIGKYLAAWIISRGGWKMIKEWFGASSRTMIGLGVLTVIAVLGTILKNK